MDTIPTLAQLGWSRYTAAARPDAARREAATRPARVVRHDGSSLLVADGTSVVHLPLPPRWEPVTVGDWLMVDDDRPVELLERRSLLRRRDPGTGDEQLLAANVDLVGIVCGLDRPVRAGRIERFVTLAWDAGATPLVVLTKADLVEDPSEARDIGYRSAPGCDVVVLSYDDPGGLDELRSQLAGGTLVLVGESGAGKSSLVNRLVGHDGVGTGSVRLGDHKGRHTTTSRQLHTIDGGCVIDSPGLREVGLVADGASVDGTFPEIAALADACRFADCSHDHEPGCAVRRAVEDGSLDDARLRSWDSLRKESAAAELRADEHARRQRDRQRQLVARDAQEVKRRGRGG